MEQELENLHIHQLEKKIQKSTPYKQILLRPWQLNN